MQRADVGCRRGYRLRADIRPLSGCSYEKCHSNVGIRQRHDIGKMLARFNFFHVFYSGTTADRHKNADVKRHRPAVMPLSGCSGSPTLHNNRPHAQTTRYSRTTSNKTPSASPCPTMSQTTRSTTTTSSTTTNKAQLNCLEAQ